MKQFFTQFSNRAAAAAGTYWAFLGALALIILWVVTGPLFNFSDGWLLFISTVTSVGSFLMVFLIQDTQNRNTKALHIKLDELIRVTMDAHNELMKAEDLTEDELTELKEQYSALCEKCGQPRLAHIVEALKR